MRKEKENNKEIESFLREAQILDENSTEKEVSDFIRIMEHADSAKLLDHINTREDWQKVRRRMRMKPRSKRIPLRTYALRIAAVVILAIGLAYGLKKITDIYTGNSRPVEVYAQNEVKEFLLPDHSKIILNKNSKITYRSDFGTKEREVELKGEAVFDVEHDAVHPFKIYAEDAVVKVTGTSFNVKCDTNMVSVGVMEGSVEFYNYYNTKQKINLEKNQTGNFYISEKKMDKIGSVDPNVFLWANIIYFDNTPFEDALQIVAGHYHKKLIMQDNVPQKLNGLYKGNTLNAVINNVKETVPGVEFVITDNEIIVHN